MSVPGFRSLVPRSSGYEKGYYAVSARESLLVSMAHSIRPDLLLVSASRHPLIHV